MVSIEERAARYLEKMEPAIQGQQGSKVAFKAALILVQDFDLGEETALRLFMNVYNPRCIPPWSEKEARHKIRSAAKATPRKPRGHLRDNDKAKLHRDTYFSRTKFRMPTKEECQAIAKSRDLQGPGCWLASQLSVLRVGVHRGQLSWGICDQDGPVAGTRTIDCTPYRATSEKTDTLVQGEDYHKPFGKIPDLPNVESVALFEGLPDFLAGWEQVLWESQIEAIGGNPFEFGNLDQVKTRIRCLPLLMLATGARIEAEYIHWFRNKSVRIFVHNEDAGRAAAQKWAISISSVATQIDFYECGRLRNKPGFDFCDSYQITTERVMP
jgi:hypothetical protein